MLDMVFPVGQLTASEVHPLKPINGREGDVVVKIDEKTPAILFSVSEINGRDSQSAASRSTESLLPSSETDKAFPTLVSLEQSEKYHIYGPVPSTTTICKIREAARAVLARTHVMFDDRRTPYKAISAQGQFGHYFIEPFNNWWNRNERLMMSKCLSTMQVQEACGTVKSVIHAASHNYTGLYDLSTESEQLQRLCLDILPLADADSVPSVEGALRAAISDFFSAQFCYLATSTYDVNSLTLSAIVGVDSLLIIDQKCHSSIHTGAYLSTAGSLQKFAHNNIPELERILLQLAGTFRKVFVMVEGLYSMDTTVPPLDQLYLLKQKFGFSIICDEAHSFLSLGTTGRGCLELWNENHPNSRLPWDLVDIRTGALSKAVGSVGGFVCGSLEFEAAVRMRAEYLKDRGHEPLSAPTMVQTLDILGQSVRIRTNLCRLKHMASFCRSELNRFNVHVYGEVISPVLPIHAGRPTTAAKLSYYLRQTGVLATPITTPAVSRWQSRVRVCLSADHSDSQVNKLLDCIIQAVQRIGVSPKIKLPRIAYRSSLPEVPLGTENDEKAKLNRQRIRDAIMQDAAATSAKKPSPSTIAFNKNCGPVVIQSGHLSRAKYGLGSGGSRWIVGTFPGHLAVERLIAEVTRMEAGMTIPNAEICLSSTIAALCRPLLGCPNHYILIPENVSEVVLEGLRMASKKTAPTVIKYANISELPRLLNDIRGRKTCVTIYFENIIDTEDDDNTRVGIDFTAAVAQLVRCRKLVGGMTILLNDFAGLGHKGPERLGIGRMFDLPGAAKSLNAHVLVCGSFYRAFGLPGGYVTGEKRLIEELRLTSRGYMFTTSPPPFIMDMIRTALEIRLGKIEG